ncbi:MAG: dihydroxyacetone kinase subunit L [Treponema sp.]|nr:dihydroxyacetone kinase subunit L [Treponema sp.]
MNATTLRGAVASISRLMTENRDYLVELDQQNGDGDLGISMAAGFKSVSDYLAAAEEKDLGKLFMKSSGILNEAAPSSLGTILSIGLMGMAKALKGKETAGIEEIAHAMEAGITAIMEKAKSKPGEKTILDALYPAIKTLKNAGPLDTAGAKAAWAKAAEAAANGSESTRAMKPVHGRAVYYGEKSIGILDGGSVVGKLIFEGISAFIASSS